LNGDEINPRCQFHHHFMSALCVQKCFMHLFSSHSLAFVIFWCKNIGAKAACKMLMKLTSVLSFKSKGFHWTNEMYDQNIFQLEDIFRNSTIVDINNTSLYKLSKIDTINYGRIYSICYLQKTSIYDGIILRLWL